ncbi:hybrid non-ribosomal peptide synthetase/type I polyketide synthase [Andreprevotia chitinilytica]|uniref:hybrid non-ribosomal peptide synthetase/type I polyketide synthase n=1 Tax=Andreprevotia chitinilytica TaxID=396808 RepID=UPI0006916CA5|nr:hybrid non-ribosomal peptide synthetase/type I polyketide synthase [Andreprevotia chitinilytica]
MADIEQFSKSQLMRLIARQQEKLSSLQAATEDKDIAIIGMSCRFPGSSNDPASFWAMLEAGIDGVSDDTSSRWNTADYLGSANEPDKAYTLSAGLVDDVELFDPLFFGISPREAQTMDPQQRLALEISWRALESAGIAASSLAGSKTGVFMGVGDNEYMQRCYDSAASENIGHVASSNALNVIAGRVAYTLGLQGPSMAIDTACSSSLVAVHLACQSLRNGESKLAIAGGVNVLVAGETFLSLSKANMLSPTGRCRTFSDSADGYVRAEGCGVVILKRLADAERDGDKVLAVLKGSAVNHDGRSSSLTAPNGPAQIAVIREALNAANIGPEQVHYIETHGTGTGLGDPIEVQSLDAVYGASHSVANPLYLGALKSNIGHAESAAGIASLIKAVLCLQKKQIPGNLHCDALNTKIAADFSRLVVPGKLSAWPTAERAIAGVSSFGFSGTNAHLIVAAHEPAAIDATAGAETTQPLPIVISARSRPALLQLLDHYQRYLASHDVPLAQFAKACALGRSSFEHRVAFFAATRDEVRSRLHSLSQAEPANHPPLGKIAFLFTGQGSQYAEMGQTLYQTNPLFRRHLDQCAEQIDQHLDQPLFSVLWGEHSADLNETRYTQPALFALEYALARFWLDLGIEPQYLMGHSVGEFAAAAIAGVFSLADASKLICARARLMSELSERGGMLAVLAPLAQVEPFLAPFADVSVGAINGPASVVLSGAEASIKAIEQALMQAGVACQPLKVSHAFHSPLMQPMLAQFRAVAEEISYSLPNYSLISNVTGQAETERFCSADYWVEHVLSPVNFHGGMQTTNAADVAVYLEVGPAATLLGMGRRCVSNDTALWLPSLRQGQCWEPINNVLAQLFERGQAINWQHVFDKAIPQAQIPGHPLQNARYWLEDVKRSHSRQSTDVARAKPAGHPLLGTALPLPDSHDHLFMANWFTRSPAYFDHHRLYNQVVVPAASHVAMILLAAEKTFAGEVFELQDLLFPEALTLGDAEDAMIQLYLKHSGETGFNIQLKRIADQIDAHRLHVEGKLLTQVDIGNAADDVTQWRSYQQDFDRQFSGASFYEEFWELGYTLGSAFCWIQEGWQRDATVLARMAPPALPDGANDYGLYPGLIDSCFQLIACCANGEKTSLNTGKIYIPFTMESFQYRKLANNAQPLWCVATLREKPTEASNRVIGDIVLFTDDGSVVARIKGFQARVTNEDGLFQMLSKKTAAKSVVYDLAWQAVATDDKVRIAADQALPWLLVGSNTLKTAFDTASVAALHVDLAAVDFHGATVPELAASWQQYLAQHAAGQAFAGIIYAGPEDDAEATHPNALAQEILLISSLISAIEREQRLVQHGFVYLGHNAAAIDAGQTVNTHAAAIQALFRVLANEGVTLALKSISIDATAQNDDLVALLNRGLGCEAEQVAVQATSCLAPYLLPATATAAPALTQGWYAISGGFNGIGLEIAKYLAKTAAQGLVLLGRSEPNAALNAFIEQCVLQGLPIRIARCDINDAAALAHWAAGLKEDGIALTGLIHAAGVVRDQPLQELDRASIEQVLAPKVAGTAYLLQVLADHPLKHVVGFSSMSALLGTNGQAAYAVANAYLNAALHNLRATRGIGLSIGWGPWADVGMASRLDESVQRYYRNRGIQAFDLERGIAAFASVANRAASNVALIDIDWAKYGSGAKASPLLSKLITAHHGNEGQLDLDGLSAEERAQAVRQATVVLLAKALNYHGDAFADDAVELTQLGVDSLIAVDLRNKLQKRFGANVAIADMMAGMTLGQLVQAVNASVGELAGDDEEIALVIRDKERHEPFPITDMQQAYWIGRTGVFDLGGLSLHGYKEIESDSLDLARFGEAWRRLVNRHDMLRAYILPSGEQVVIQHPAPYQIAEHDLRGLPADQVAAQLAEIREEMSHQVLPLDTWPAFDLRASLLDGNKTRLHISVDGTYLDFRSFLILFRELILLYKDLEHPLPALEMTFRDYVLTLRAQEGTKAYQRSLDYWTKRIETIAPAPELPLAKKPSQVKNHRSKRWESSLPVAQWESFKTHMHQHGLTQAAVLLAVYGEVLATWSSSPRFCINVPVFNRQGWHPDVNNVLGNFSSFTLVECDYSVQMSFVDRVKEVQRQMMEGLQHHHIGGVQIMRMINQVRGKIAAGAYPCVYTSLPSGVDEWDSSLKSMITRELGEIQYTISQTPQVWLDVHVWYESGGLEFNWDGVEELFPAGMVDSMFAAYCSMIEALAQDGATWAQQRINLLPPSQVALFDEANATLRPISDLLLQEKFYAAAELFPNHAAVITSRGEVSYQALRAQANQIAHFLRCQGIGRNDLVAVAIGKGAEQITAVMGILIAGGAYLPVDINQPQSRIDYLLQNGDVKVVLTSDEGGSQAPQRRQWPENVIVETVAAVLAAEPNADDLAPVQSQRDLAYVLYTSGSTGKPKGVMITHRNVINMVEHTNDHFGVNANDRAFNITALNHDLSVYDIFGCLSAGAAIVIPDEDKRREPLHWLQLMQAHRVSLWNSVPALMDMLLEAIGEPGDEVEHVVGAPVAAVALPELRVVILGGDWVPPAIPSRIKRVAPIADLLSIGGPTETTVWNIWNFMNDAQPDWASIPYGKPISNSQYFILGASGKPCPVWVEGELHCAGECVAPGYLNDPDNTARSFVRHPYTDQLIYKTGDLGRYLPDGRIEFLGRRDFQMKIRGQRIEAGEIEHALLAFPGVENAAVVDAGDGLQKHLVAHIAMAGVGKNMAQANKTADFLSEDEQRDVLTNPIERLEFTLGERGIRHFNPNLARLELLRGDESRLEQYLRRQSFRQYNGELTLAKLEQLLAPLSIERMDGQVLPKYRYPSAGGLYPVQAYLYIKPDAIPGVVGGYYYYDPSASELVQLTGASDINEQLYAGYLKPLAEAAVFSLFLVADLAAIKPMYGEVARDFCLLEAGYVGQLLMTEAVGNLVGLCPVGGIQESAAFREALQLSDSHIVVHSLTGGGISEEQTSYWLEKPKAAADADTEETTVSALTLEERLQEHLRQYVPEYMVPTRFVLHEKLALTENGKIDRKSLKASANTFAALKEPEVFAAPTSPVEQRFADILAEILNVPRVSIDGNFFEMGANSIHMVKIQKRFKEDLGRELAVTDLFRYPTLRSLVAFLHKDPDEKRDFSDSRDRAAKRASARNKNRPRNATDVENV